MKKFTLWCTGEPAREHALNALYIAMHCSNIVNITVHSESNLYAVCEFLDPNLALLAKQWFFHNSTINSKYIYESIFIYTLYLYTIYSCCFYAASMYSYQGNLTWIYTWSYRSLNGFNWIHWPLWGPASKPGMDLYGSRPMRISLDLHSHFAMNLILQCKDQTR